MIRKQSAGDIVETRCTRCRKIMNHTIVAMVGEQIVRVECNTCHGMHNYHPLKEAKAPATPKTPAAAKTTMPRKAPVPRKEKVDPVAVECAEWEALRPTMDPDQALPYDMNGTYRAKKLVLHPTFGLGIVRLVIPPNKIEVLFQQGKKLLKCG